METNNNSLVIPVIKVHPVLPEKKRGRKTSRTKQGKKKRSFRSVVGELQTHLQSIFCLLRSQDTITLAVKLESLYEDHIRYMVLVSTLGVDDSEETIIVGVDMQNNSSTIGLVLPIWGDTVITMDGDGGFSVCTKDRAYIFKPVSIQAMWSAIQCLDKSCQTARIKNYFPSGLNLTWRGYYESRISSPQSCINEWQYITDVDSRRKDERNIYHERYQMEGHYCPTERELTERHIWVKLREIMTKVDLDNITCRAVRERLEEEMGRKLSVYKGFIDEQMLVILGQLDSASQIFDHLYLGSEWNASNYDELDKNGIRYILNVTKEIDNFFPAHFTYHNVRLYDTECADLLKYWDDTYRFLSKAKETGAKALVHCKMGISRSAATVIAYAMKENNWSLERSMRHVKERRKCIQPNPAFMQQLIEYKGILDASNQRHNLLWRSKSESSLSTCASLENLVVLSENISSSEDVDNPSRRRSWSPQERNAQALLDSYGCSSSLKRNSLGGSLQDLSKLREDEQDASSESSDDEEVVQVHFNDIRARFEGLQESSSSVSGAIAGSEEKMETNNEEAGYPLLQSEEMTIEMEVPELLVDLPEDKEKQESCNIQCQEDVNIGDEIMQVEESDESVKENATCEEKEFADESFESQPDNSSFNTNNNSATDSDTSRDSENEKRRLSLKGSVKLKVSNIENKISKPGASPDSVDNQKKDFEMVEEGSPSLTRCEDVTELPRLDTESSEQENSVLPVISTKDISSVQVSQELSSEIDEDHIPSEMSDYKDQQAQRNDESKVDASVDQSETETIEKNKEKFKSWQTKGWKSPSRELKAVTPLGKSKTNLKLDNSKGEEVEMKAGNEDWSDEVKRESEADETGGNHEEVVDVIVIDLKDEEHKEVSEPLEASNQRQVDSSAKVNMGGDEAMETSSMNINETQGEPKTEDDIEISANANEGETEPYSESERVVYTAMGEAIPLQPGTVKRQTQDFEQLCLDTLDKLKEAADKADSVRKGEDEKVRGEAGEKKVEEGEKKVQEGEKKIQGEKKVQEGEMKVQGEIGSCEVEVAAADEEMKEEKGIESEKSDPVTELANDANEEEELKDGGEGDSTTQSDFNDGEIPPQKVTEKDFNKKEVVPQGLVDEEKCHSEVAEGHDEGEKKCVLTKDAKPAYPDEGSGWKIGDVRRHRRQLEDRITKGEVSGESLKFKPATVTITEDQWQRELSAEELRNIRDMGKIALGADLEVEMERDEEMDKDHEEEDDRQTESDDGSCVLPDNSFVKVQERVQKLEIKRSATIAKMDSERILKNGRNSWWKRRNPQDQSGSSPDESEEEFSDSSALVKMERSSKKSKAVRLKMDEPSIELSESDSKLCVTGSKEKVIDDTKKYSTLSPEMQSEAAGLDLTLQTVSQSDQETNQGTDFDRKEQLQTRNSLSDPDISSPPIEKLSEEGEEDKFCASPKTFRPYQPQQGTKVRRQYGPTHPLSKWRPKSGKHPFYSTM